MGPYYFYYCVRTMNKRTTFRSFFLLTFRVIFFFISLYLLVRVRKKEVYFLGVLSSFPLLITISIIFLSLFLSLYLGNITILVLILLFISSTFFSLSLLNFGLFSFFYYYFN